MKCNKCEATLRNLYHIHDEWLCAECAPDDCLKAHEAPPQQGRPAHSPDA